MYNYSEESIERARHLTAVKTTHRAAKRTKEQTKGHNKVDYRKNKNDAQRLHSANWLTQS
ncbi:MAG TPA: hypothetical protein P5186_16285 [Candidatus Paceibacterota bacterium]|nr:hypothetical protein [Candidatus Paceibacterota bacterium]